MKVPTLVFGLLKHKIYILLITHFNCSSA